MALRLNSSLSSLFRECPLYFLVVPLDIQFPGRQFPSTVANRNPSLMSEIPSDGLFPILADPFALRERDMSEIKGDSRIPEE
jgi:hypothetical protein